MTMSTYNLDQYVKLVFIELANWINRNRCHSILTKSQPDFQPTPKFYLLSTEVVKDLHSLWLTWLVIEIKCKRKPNVHSRMDNLETLVTLGTQDTGRRQAKQKTQHRKLKRWETQSSPKTAGEPRCSQRVSSSCFL